MNITSDKLVKMLGTMLTIRLFEEKVKDLYARGKIPGLAHLYIGEEAVATGVCEALERGDYITSTHRGHGHVLAKGAHPKFMMAELFGKATGYCKGKGGSMHIADIDLGILGANGIAGGGLPIAVGAGLSSKIRGEKKVVACFFGDGASNNGTFHESLNLAAVWKLPVIFVCENNFYGISVPQKKHQAISEISVRSMAYGIPGVTVDGNDVIAVYEAAEKAVSRARAGEGPTLIECRTYRFRGHHEGDPNLGARYREKSEIEEWLEKCPIRRLKEKLISEKIVTEGELEDMTRRIEKELEEAVRFAEESPYPEVGELWNDVYA